MGFSMMEMDLIRVETHHHNHGGKIQELFLGDIHTDWAQRTHQLRPTGYQQPLQSVMVPPEFVFKVTQVRVTAVEEPTAKLLNRSRPGKCGQTGGWEVGVEQDVTTTDGCTVLGIKLPHKEYELFKTELNHRKHPLLLIERGRPTGQVLTDRREDPLPSGSPGTMQWQGNSAF
ncbi:unnamed protein product [Lampetra planeri]